MKLEAIKQGVSSFLDSVAEGWRHLSESATNALTRFSPGAGSSMPPPERVDDPFYRPSRSWSLLGGEVFEDANRIVVRLEVPGMDRQDMTVEVDDASLIIRGEKRFTAESAEGRWRIMQCAYGSFRRVVPLSVPVRADDATASYAKGVLRIELPKAGPGVAPARTIRVE
ncbi:Hsp20/alpha crystallin family protein [Propionivibrio dicarboxylicus]|uniref:HSP20 family protein n=1 Tax=Propionivibrio dicarboxylicus TaxID=83767 RepID=A0A1G8AAK5_9RHOO|nr:Hsp20/alpha crystallin family protein [Propionivibrio dicarboxylicus]SDH17919.1 HSP20 family protein [Propionivibrio dicarboxylicus]